MRRGPSAVGRERARCAAVALALAAAAGCDRTTSGTLPPIEASSSPEWGKRTIPHWTGFNTGARWSRRIDAASLHAAVDAAGNAVVLSTFASRLGWGDPPLESAGYLDLFVAKIGPRGELAWSRAFGNPRLQHCEDVAVTPAGDVVLAGSSQGPLAIDGVTLALRDDTVGQRFVVKLDAAGRHRWSQPLEGHGDAHLAVDAAGRVLVLESRVSGDGGARLRLFDPEGKAVYGRSIERDLAASRSWTDAPSLAAALDGAGGVALAGAFAKELDLGGGAKKARSAGLDDAFVARLDPAGKALWAARFGGAGSEAAHAVAVDPTGAIVIGGDFDADLALEPGQAAPPPSEPPRPGCFVAKLDPAGKPLWSRKLRAVGGTASLRSVAVRPGGEVVVAGSFSGTLDVGAGPMRAQGPTDAFVIELSADGSVLWARRFGDDLPQHATDVDVDAEGGVLLTGSQPVGWAGDTSDSDWFVVALPPGGGAP